MTRILRATHLAAAIAIAGGLFVNARPALAQTPDRTTFRTAIYGYIPNLNARTSFPTPLGDEIDIKGDTLLENTDLALMGMFEVSKNRIGGFVDVMYFNVGTTKNGTRDLLVPGIAIPATVTADATVDLKAWVVMGAGSVRLAAGPRGRLDAFGGVRRLSIDTTLDYAFSSSFGPFVGPSQAGRSEASGHNWDGIGGVRGQLTLGRWVVPYYADAGAGDSDLTWQTMIGLAYSFKHVEIGGVYRYLDYDMKSDRKLSSLTLSGPAIGVAFKW
jgi:hypothetical protein